MDREKRDAEEEESRLEKQQQLQTQQVKDHAAEMERRRKVDEEFVKVRPRTRANPAAMFGRCGRPEKPCIRRAKYNSLDYITEFTNCLKHPKDPRRTI